MYVCLCCILCSIEYLCVDRPAAARAAALLSSLLGPVAYIHIHTCHTSIEPAAEASELLHMGVTAVGKASLFFS